MAPTITDELHAMLLMRADDLEGCAEGSDEERELAAIESAIGAYAAGPLAHRQDRRRQGIERWTSLKACPELPVSGWAEVLGKKTGNTARATRMSPACA